MVFIATPHRGLGPEALGVLFKGNLSDELVKDLEVGSQTLKYLNKCFCTVSKNMKILTLHESIKTPIHFHVSLIFNLFYKRILTGTKRKTVAAGKSNTL